MYSGVDDPLNWVLPRVIEEHARLHGDRPAVAIIGGAALTYRQLSDQASQVAGFFAGLGVKSGDRVAIMAPNGLDFIRAWTGAGRLGATAVLLNTELMGAFLAHPLRDASPDILVICGDWLDRLEPLRSDLPGATRIVVTGPASCEEHHIPFDGWRTAAAFEGPFPTASDIACIMYTSGTTGAPKGVLMPHAHCFLFGLGLVENIAVSQADHYYICLPLSHANGLLMQLGAVLIAGARATVRERFSASAWLDDIRACGATLTNSLGAISAFVLARPADARDKAHHLRAMLTTPNHPDHARVWHERFGIAHVIGGYGMTETNIPLYEDLAAPRPGTCGRVYARCFEVEIRDPETDQPVPRGEVGEIMVRPRIAPAFMAGYNNLPDKTVEAWRNLWFHTGDAARMDESGCVTFVDRMKDCIRRRGENISAVDIEVSVAQLPGVAEISAYAVPSDVPGCEDEIMLAIVLQPGLALEPGEIVLHARKYIPRFAQPRYVEFLDALPKTATEKVRKAELRKVGVTARTIDLENQESWVTLPKSTA